MLQEYLAARIGVQIGRYYQISNNFHAYTAELTKRRLLITMVPLTEFTPHYPEPPPAVNPYDSYAVATSIVTQSEHFDADLQKFMGGGTALAGPLELSYHNRFFPEIALPMFTAYKLWRAQQREEAYKRLLQLPEQSDWVIASRAWMGRRMYQE